MIRNERGPFDHFRTFQNSSEPLLIVEGVEIGLAQDLAMTEDEVLSQTATMGVEDVLETMAPVPREELIVVALAGEAEEADGDEAGRTRAQVIMQEVVAAPDKRMRRDADDALLPCGPAPSDHGASAAARCLGQIVH